MTIDVLPTELQPALLVGIEPLVAHGEPASLVATVFSAVPPTTVLRHPAFLSRQVSVKVVVILLGLLDVLVCIRITQRGRAHRGVEVAVGEHIDSPLRTAQTICTTQSGSQVRARVNRCLTDIPAALSARRVRVLDTKRLLVHTGAVPRSIPVVNELSNRAVNVHVVVRRRTVVAEGTVHALV